jgi:hypothetical protein
MAFSYIPTCTHADWQPGRLEAFLRALSKARSLMPCTQALAQSGRKELVQRRLLGATAHAHQRTDQRWQGQLAVAGEGFGELGMRRAPRKFVAAQQVGKVQKQVLYACTVFRPPS